MPYSSCLNSCGCGGRAQSRSLLLVSRVFSHVSYNDIRNLSQSNWTPIEDHIGTPVTRSATAKSLRLWATHIQSVSVTASLRAISSTSLCAVSVQDLETSRLDEVTTIAFYCVLQPEITIAYTIQSTLLNGHGPIVRSSACQSTILNVIRPTADRVVGIYRSNWVWQWWVTVEIESVWSSTLLRGAACAWHIAVTLRSFSSRNVETVSTITLAAVLNTVILKPSCFASCFASIDSHAIVGDHQSGKSSCVWWFRVTSKRFVCDRRSGENACLCIRSKTRWSSALCSCVSQAWHVAFALIGLLASSLWAITTKALWPIRGHASFPSLDNVPPANTPHQTNRNSDMLLHTVVLSWPCCTWSSQPKLDP